MAENESGTPETEAQFSRRSLAALRVFLRPYYWKGAMVLGLTLVGVALDILPVSLLEQILDRAVRPRDTHLLFVLCSALLAAILFREGANTLLRWVFFGAAESFLCDMRMALYNRLLSQSQAFYRGRDVGEISSRVLNDLQALQRVLSIAILSPVANGLFIVGMLGYLFTLDWHLACVLVVVLPIYALAQRPIMNRIGAQERRMREDTDDLAGELVESLQNIEEIQSSSVEPRQRERMGSRLGKLRISSTWLQNLYGLVQTTSGLISGLASLAVLAFGGYLAATDVITAGVLVAFVTATVQILRPVEDVMNLAAQLTGAKVLADRIGEFLLAVPDVEEKAGARDLGALTAAPVHFNKITFGYKADQPILRDFELSIAAGERVALVGPSGSGKSTVLHLVRRFFDVQNGLVLIGGQDVKDLTLRSLRSQIATVNQRPSLFHGSIRDNISLGLPATDVELHAAATAAHLDSDLSRLEGGLDFNVGPDGGRLSGGQRQRVALARAILRDTPVLLLDEATSALDADSQAAVLKALDALLAREPRKTCIVVAHRLSTVRSCDRIIVIDGGRVAESGTYDELIRLKGMFAQLAATELESDHFDMSGWETEGAGQLGLANRDWALGGSTGAGVRVAIVDTGVDGTHPFLEGALTRFAGAVQGADGTYTIREEPHKDTAGHGTACAGIIHEIAPAAELWSVRVLGSDGRGSGDAFVAGLAWAIRQRVDVCSLSMGTTSARYFGTLHDLADEAYYHGVLLVVAASNRPTMSFPALYPSVIGVAAVDEPDPVKLYYNLTPPVEFMTAGVNVRVAQPNGAWAVMTGNSFAAPRVSALCALIRQRHPRLDSVGVKTILRDIAEPRTKLNPAVGYP